MARIALVGCGFIGGGWAISFARAGHEVVLWDEDPPATSRVRDFAADILPDLAANGLLGNDTPAEVLARIRAEPDLAAAVAGAAHVQESAPERLDIKQALFARLDALAPPTAVIASSSSAILPSRFTEKLPGRHRCLVVHPINPPYLVPAVEVVPAPWTSPDVVERSRALLASAGHRPIVMKRELDGFVINRLQGALLEEAFRLVADGYATVEDVDVGVRDGLALRWSFMGPFETIDLNAPGGVRDYVVRYEGIYRKLFGQMQRRVDWSGPVLLDVVRERRRRLPEDQLAARRLWRDRRLMALAAQKRRAASEIGE
jgi:3-hydroxyacyl-CoA dehydrogenase